MKKYTFLLIMLGYSISIFAQQPLGFAYQAALRDKQGSLLSDQNISVVFHIQSSVSGGELYSEKHITKTSALGLVNLTVGTGQKLTGNFDLIDWSTKKFLAVDLDINGQGIINLGTNELLVVPYALYAANVGSLSDIVLSPAFSGTGTSGDPFRLAKQGASNGQVLKWNDVASNWVPAKDEVGVAGQGDDWGSQVVETDATLKGDGTAANPLKLNQQNALPGQSLVWNGTKWVPSTVVGKEGPEGPQGPQGQQGPQGPAGPAGSYSAGTAITIANNTISVNLAQVPASGSAGGDLSGTYPNPNVSKVQGKDFSFDGYQPNEIYTLKYFGSEGVKLSYDYGSEWYTSGGTTTLSNGNGLLPWGNNVVDLGKSSQRWKVLYCVDVSTGSDRKLKQNIEPVHYGLKSLMKLNPVSYQFIADDEKRNRMGFIAQEMETVIPDIVRKDEKDNYNLSYLDLIAVLTKSIQEQQALIESQQKEINEIKSLLNKK